MTTEFTPEKVSGPYSITWIALENKTRNTLLRKSASRFPFPSLRGEGVGDRGMPLHVSIHSFAPCLGSEDHSLRPEKENGDLEPPFVVVQITFYFGFALTGIARSAVPGTVC